jgi:peptidyl-tRNA hydrolase
MSENNQTESKSDENIPTEPMITEPKIIINEQKPRNQMFILVNTDLKMEKGKIAGQVGHVVGIITEHIIRTAYEISIKKHFPLSKLASEYTDFNANSEINVGLYVDSDKIAINADVNKDADLDTDTDPDTETENILTDSDIDAFCDYIYYMRWCKYDGHVKIVLKASEADINGLIATETKYKYIRDAGRTQIAPNSLTVLGFFPRDDLKEKMTKYKLL